MESHLLPLILIVLALAVAVQLLCQRLRVPTIVGFLLTGLLIGPGGLGWVPAGNQELADLGVVLLLFTIGAEFSFRRLVQMRRYVLLGGACQVLTSILLVSLLAWSKSQSPGQAVFIGYLVAMSSTAILFRMLQERSEIESPHGRLAIGMSIFQDLASVIMMLSLPMLAGHGGAVGSALLKIGWQGAAILAMVWVMARHLVPMLLNRIARTRSRELFLLATLLICLGIPWLTERLGLSIGIGAFLAGLILAETEYSHQALAGIMPFKDVFSSMFFISIGMLFDPHLLAQTPWLVLLLVCAVIVLKLGITGLTGLLLGFPLRTALLAGLLLANTGEFTFVIAALGRTAGLLSAAQYQTVIAVTVLTMAATPLLMRLSGRLTQATQCLPLPPRVRSRLRDGEPADQYTVDTALRDHLIVIGYGLIGRNVVRAAQTAGLPFVIIEMNHETARRERMAGLPILGGDATQDTLLESARINHAALVVIAVPDPAETRKITQAARRLGGQAHIIARTRFAGQIPELQRIGADDVVPDEFEAAVAIVSLALQRFLLPRAEIERALHELRAEAYEVLRAPLASGMSLGDLGQAQTEYELSSMRIGAASALAGHTLAELDLRRRHGVTLLAIRRGAAVIANPTGEERLEPEDILICYGTPEQMLQLAPETD